MQIADESSRVELTWFLIRDSVMIQATYKFSLCMRIYLYISNLKYIIHIFYKIIYRKREGVLTKNSIPSIFPQASFAYFILYRFGNILRRLLLFALINRASYRSLVVRKPFLVLSRFLFLRSLHIIHSL